MQAGFDMDLYLDWRRDGHPNGLNPFDLTSAGEAVGKVDWG